MKCFRFEVSFFIEISAGRSVLVMYPIKFKIFSSIVILYYFFFTVSTTCILEDKSLWILDWEAIVSNVVSVMLSGRTCLFNAFSMDRTPKLKKKVMLCNNLCLEDILSRISQPC